MKELVVKFNETEEELMFDIINEIIDNIRCDCNLELSYEVKDETLKITDEKEVIERIVSYLILDEHNQNPFTSLTIM